MPSSSNRPQREDSPEESSEKLPDPVAAARDPKTHAPTLKRLASYGAGGDGSWIEQQEQRRVRRAVAQNPNTPLETLLDLAEDFPKAFVLNPAVRLLNLESPDVLERLSRRGALTSERLGGILGRTEVPPAWLVWGSTHRHWKLRLAVAANAQTPARLLRRLAGDTATVVRQAVAEHDATPAPALEHLADDEDFHVREAVAWHRKALPGALMRLSERYLGKGESLLVRRALSFRSLSLVRLATYENPRFDDADLARAALLRLSEDPDETVRRQAARGRRRLTAVDPDIHVDTAELLAEDRDAGVRRRIAERRDMPHTFLERLAGDDALEVRFFMVSNNPAVPASLLALLAQDRDERVRRNVAAHPNASVDTLRRLAGDEDARVRRRAEKAMRPFEQLLAALTSPASRLAALLSSRKPSQR